MADRDDAGSSSRSSNLPSHTHLDTSVAMLCDVCFRMLRGQDGRVWKGTYDLHFQHHSDEDSLHRSAGMNCGICRVLYEELSSKKSNSTPKPSITTTKHAQLLDVPDKETQTPSRGDEINPRSNSRSSSPGGPRFEVTGMLSVLDHPRVKDLYRLDFKIRHAQIRSRRTFILQKISMVSNLWV